MQTMLGGGRVLCGDKICMTMRRRLVGSLVNSLISLLVGWFGSSVKPSVHLPLRSAKLA